MHYLKRVSRLIFWLLLLPCIGGVEIWAQTAIPTFHSIGLSWKSENGSEQVTCAVFYRAQGTEEWKSGLPLWFDHRNREYRGSIVHVSPGTTYEIRLNLKELNQNVNITTTTWSEELPISETIYLPKYSNETFTIDRSGSVNGYLLYTSPPGDTSIIDINNDAKFGVVMAPGISYVILRGVKIRGPAVHGILINDDSHHIVIERNDISNWGNAAEDNWGIDRQSGIFSARKHKNIESIIIQENKIHHPRSNSNSWAEKRLRNPTDTSANRYSFHPAGPNAIHLGETSGNLVIRYNEIYSDDGHYFNDGMGGAGNYSFQGFPNANSDIYGNIISHCWDDGIESEGANKNVRIWGNYIDKTYVKIAIAGTSIGPLYIWRNIANESRKSAVDSNPVSYGRGPFLKAGGKEFDNVFYGGGKTYVFHNTVLQPSSSAGVLLGSEAAIQSSGGYLENLTTRNNIFLNYKNWRATFIDNARDCSNDFDFDLYTGTIKSECDSQHQKSGFKLTEIPSGLLKKVNSHAYILTRESPGYDAAVPIPNFNDIFDGRGPDIGAMESNGELLKFGLRSTVKEGWWPPWIYLVISAVLLMGAWIIFRQRNSKKYSVSKQT